MITPMRVFVLLFNAGKDNEGIYTQKVGDRDKVLMFESEDDATRYALMLEAQDFLAPAVEAIDAEEVKEFCQSAGYDWEIVQNDAGVLMPPEANVEKTDWQANAEEKAQSEDTQQPPELSDSELDSIRRKLEGLI
jgi:Protein of unknown function (DUF3110)